MPTESVTRKYFSASMVALFISLAAPASARAGAEDEVRDLFGKFVVAQNAHDLKAVGEILRDSPQVLWITRDPQTGRPAPFWGRDAALKRFEQFYQGTWSLEPKVDEIKVTELSPGVVQLLAPTVFRIAPPGQTAAPTLILLSHIYLRTDAGWKLVSIFPIVVP
jgi:hypothetical protein